MIDSRCSARVYGDGRGGMLCSRKGKVTSANGKLYCAQHLPETVKAGQDARRAKFNTEWERTKQKHELDRLERAARTALLQAIRNPLREDVLFAAKVWEEAVTELEVIWPSA